jgi:hypothetical protein
MAVDVSVCALAVRAVRDSSATVKRKIGREDFLQER